MGSTSTEKTLDVLRNLFASYGLPEQLVSDNGPQFTSAEFEKSMKLNGIKHIRTSPYHPASNGEAERFVQTFKRALKAEKNIQATLQQKLARFLLTYRSTPSMTTGVTPAELFLKRALRTRLDLLRPSLKDHVSQKQAQQSQQHNSHSKDRQFDIGQPVLLRNLRGEPKWLEGTIIEKTGPVSYRVQVGDLIWRRHVDHILDRGISGCRDASDPPSDMGQFPTHGNPPAITEVEPYITGDGTVSPEMRNPAEDCQSELISPEKQTLESRTQPKTPESSTQPLEHQPEGKTPTPDTLARRYPQRDRRKPDRLTYQ